MSLPVKLRLTLDAFIIVFFAVTAYVSLEWQMSARIMPLSVSVMAVLLGVANLIFDVVRWRRVGFAFINVDRGNVEDLADSRAEATAQEASDILLGMRYFGWIVAFSVLVSLAGVLIGAAAFLLVFLRFEGGYSWRYTAMSVVAVLLAILAVEAILDLRLPSNFLDLW